MRSRIRAENIKAVSQSKPGFPYEPFDSGEFSDYDIADYNALPAAPMLDTSGWKYLDAIPAPTELTWVSWITATLRTFNIAENNGKEVGVMRNPHKPQTLFFVKAG